MFIEHRSTSTNLVHDDDNNDSHSDITERTLQLPPRETQDDEGISHNEIDLLMGSSTLNSIANSSAIVVSPGSRTSEFDQTNDATRPLSHKSVVKRARKQEATDDLLDKTLINTMNSINRSIHEGNSLNNHNEQEDEDMLFVKLIVPQLKRFDPGTRAMEKLQTAQYLFSLEFPNLQMPSI